MKKILWFCLSVIFVLLVVSVVMLVNNDTLTTTNIRLLSERVSRLEKERDQERFALSIFKEQVRGQVTGRIVAQTYSSKDAIVSFSAPLPSSGNSVTHFGERAETATPVSLYDRSGNLLDTFILKGVVRPGDFVIAWHAKEPHLSDKIPWSPDYWGVPAYYWNRKSGLAVSIVHFDGSSTSAAVVR